MQEVYYIIYRAIVVIIITAISLTLTSCNQHLKGLANPEQVHQTNTKDLTANMGALSIRKTPAQEIDNVPELEFNESLRHAGVYSTNCVRGGQGLTDFQI